MQHEQFASNLMKRVTVNLALILSVSALASEAASGNEPPDDQVTAAQMNEQTSEPKPINMKSTTQPAHTNKLIDATSPYLLQHAHNPVDWHEWGSEALAKAKEQNKPIFLSIGYSACHWCHVMERESFENEEIAAVMNEHYINIKVDREERPDLDDIYMSATQALTRSGGWPMSVWLTPDLKPFYAGTYFPPTSRYGRPGFKDVLLFLNKAWNEERDKVLQQAEQLTEAVQQITVTAAGELPVPAGAIEAATNFIAQRFDPTKGGILSGNTNKFPPSMALELMLRGYARSTQADKPEARLLELVDTTLENMAYGGIYDHLGGGIARYSTDPDWLVPHFEKMLYDQALVTDIYLSAYQLTGNPLYAATARSICDYVIEDLQDEAGGYYSARDADSEGEEGKFYVWSVDEIHALLGADDGKLFCQFYDVTPGGNWEGKNILNVPNEPVVFAKQNNLDVEELNQKLAAARAKLLTARAKRIPPHLDDKVLAGWNGLMIAAMARAGRVLDDERYRTSAAKAADFVLSHMTDDAGRLQRTWRKGKTHTLGYLDDYAFTIDALLDLFETTQNIKWLDAAAKLQSDLDAHYLDKNAGGYFFTADDAETVLVRMKNANDNAVPSGNSVQLMNLQRLAILLDRPVYREQAEKMLACFGDKVNQMAFSSERFLAGADFFHQPTREVAIVYNNATQKDAAVLLAAVFAHYVPNKVVVAMNLDDPQATEITKKLPLMRDKKLLDGKATAFVCQNYACQAPTTDPKVLQDQLAALRVATPTDSGGE